MNVVNSLRKLPLGILYLQTGHLGWLLDLVSVFLFLISFYLMILSVYCIRNDFLAPLLVIMGTHTLCVIHIDPIEPILSVLALAVVLLCPRLAILGLEINLRVLNTLVGSYKVVVLNLDEMVFVVRGKVFVVAADLEVGQSALLYQLLLSHLFLFVGFPFLLRKLAFFDVFAVLSVQVADQVIWLVFLVSSVLRLLNITIRGL